MLADLRDVQEARDRAHHVPHVTLRSLMIMHHNFE
jgi:hypothetical protein